MAKRNPAKKQVANTESQLPAEMNSAWGGENLTKEDIIIPKILLMQGLSEMVTEGDAKMGEFRNSMEKEVVLGSDKKPVEVIIFGSYKTVQIFIDGEYNKTESWTPAHAELPWEEILEGGGTVKRTTCQNYYCIIPSEVAKGEAFPFIITFKGMSFRGGQGIATHIQKLARFKKPSAAKVFAIKAVKTKNDKGTFFVMEGSPVRDASVKEIKEAFGWHQTFMKANVKAHAEGAEETSATPRPATQGNEQANVAGI